MCLIHFQDSISAESVGVYEKTYTFEKIVSPIRWARQRGGEASKTASHKLVQFAEDET